MHLRHFQACICDSCFGLINSIQFNSDSFDSFRSQFNSATRRGYRYRDSSYGSIVFSRFDVRLDFHSRATLEISLSGSQSERNHRTRHCFRPLGDKLDVEESKGSSSSEERSRSRPSDVTEKIKRRIGRSAGELSGHNRYIIFFLLLETPLVTLFREIPERSGWKTARLLEDDLSL